MIYRNNLFAKKILSLGILVSILSSVVYLPTFTPKAEAQFIDPFQMAKTILNGVAIAVAGTLTDQIVRSTIAWANTGFEGNPGFVTNPQSFLESTARRGVEAYISDTKFSLLCAPFQASIRLSLVQQYTTPDFYPQCTLDQIGVNWDSFLNDFQEGGWDAFLKVSNDGSSNPYAAYSNARLEMDQRIINALGIEQQQLQINLGFLSKKRCEGPTNPAYTSQDMQDYRDGLDTPRQVELKSKNWRPDLPAGACLGTEVVTTPGSLLKTGLDAVLPSELEKYVNLTEAEQLVAALVTGLMQKFVSNNTGLFGDDYGRKLASSGAKKIPTPKFGWIYCASEGEFCGFNSDGGTDGRVRIVGQKISGVTLTGVRKVIEDVEDGIMCTKQEFDLDGNLVNIKCEFYGQTRGPYSPTSSDDTSNWIKCADEGGICSFFGTRQVRYGSDPYYFLRIGTNSVQCRNSTFGGDPLSLVGISNVPKTCEYRQPSPPPVGSNPSTPPPPLESLTCSPNKTAVNRFETVTWTAVSTYQTPASYRWIGDEMGTTSLRPLDSSIKNYSLPYSTIGSKNAAVLVRQEGKPDITYNCSRPVQVLISIGGGFN